MSGGEHFGFMFISEWGNDSAADVITEDELNEKAEEIMDEASEKYEEWLGSLGLEQVMGIVRKKI